MSRIGFKSIKIPDNVKLTINDNFVHVVGPKGNLDVNFDSSCVTFDLINDVLNVKPLNDKKKTKMNHGTTRANINNAIIGVTKGFEKKLEINGIGYKANMQGDKLCLNIGFSHPVFIKPIANSKIICQDATNIIVEGIDKCAVGNVAASIRNVRPPEPYNGKGIRYFGEIIIKKEGKRVVTSTTTSGGATSGSTGKK